MDFDDRMVLLAGGSSNRGNECSCPEGANYTSPCGSGSKNQASYRRSSLKKSYAELMYDDKMKVTLGGKTYTIPAPLLQNVGDTSIVEVPGGYIKTVKVSDFDDVYSSPDWLAFNLDRLNDEVQSYASQGGDTIYENWLNHLFGRIAMLVVCDKWCISEFEDWINNRLCWLDDCRFSTNSAGILVHCHYSCDEIYDGNPLDDGPIDE